jgi:hypothetical protein
MCREQNAGLNKMSTISDGNGPHFTVSEKVNPCSVRMASTSDESLNNLDLAQQPVPDLNLNDGGRGLMDLIKGMVAGKRSALSLVALCHAPNELLSETSTLTKLPNSFRSSCNQADQERYNQQHLHK